ncbi:MAG: hypothetical protein PHZ07_03280 [Patescibacteria group bacterium]|nr:hypothetical protein [Patescibacteria group bacterium]MDD4304358.1 hypothetical protein [Patescibacteria group bacterium]MDD4695381.1 hypothetical protein [Patescibacteria group bacterium]
MIESSKDILNLVIAFCILWFTVFVCWFIYYMISTIKKVHDSINFFHTTLSSFNELVETVRDKINGSASNFKLIGMLIEKGVEIISKKIKNKTKTKSSSSIFSEKKSKK